MSLWGKYNNIEALPKYLIDGDTINESVSTPDYYGLTPQLDSDNAIYTEKNKAIGIHSPGWAQHITYIDANGNTRHRSELLVPTRIRSLAQYDTWIDDVLWADSTILGKV